MVKEVCKEVEDNMNEEKCITTVHSLLMASILKDQQRCQNQGKCGRESCGLASQEMSYIYQVVIYRKLEYFHSEIDHVSRKKFRMLLIYCIKSLKFFK